MRFWVRAPNDLTRNGRHSCWWARVSGPLEAENLQAAVQTFMGQGAVQEPTAVGHPIFRSPTGARFAFEELAKSN